MRIGIIGSGLIGGKLGTVFARAGHDVTFSYSRKRAKLEKLAAAVGAKAGTPAEAARGADAVLLAVHWDRVDDALAQAGALTGKLVISCTLPMNADDTALVLGTTISGAETLAAKLKGARVVSAFSSVPSEVLYAVYEARKNKTRPDLVYCGDNAKAKATVADLIRDVGFNPVDLGKLASARLIEPFSLLNAYLAYEKPEGPAVCYRFPYLRERDRP